MNKRAKSLIVLFLAFLLGSCFSIDSVQAQNDKLILEVTKRCDIQYAGDNCVAELKITNNTGKVLDGETSLHIGYQGICGDGSFDGEGIEARFSIIDNNWLNFSGWENGTTTVSGFSIAKGETQPKLKIETHPALCPGEYTFSLELKGTTEKEEYITPPVVLAVIGGGGGYSFNRIEEQEEEPAQISEEIEAGKEEEKPVYVFEEASEDREEEEEKKSTEEFEEVRPLENSDEEAVRGRTYTEAEEEPVVESVETGLGWLLAGIGNLFRLENLWWLLLLFIIIIIILYWLSRKKKRK